MGGLAKVDTCVNFARKKANFADVGRLHARYICSRDALGLKANQPAGQAWRAMIGYLVYKGEGVKKNCGRPLWMPPWVLIGLSEFLKHIPFHSPSKGNATCVSG